MWGCKKGVRILSCSMVAALFASLIVQATESSGSAEPVSFLYNANEVYSSRYTQPETSDVQAVSLDLEGFAPIMENEALAVYIREETGALRVCDKASGYVWGTLSADKPEDLNQTWSKLGNSLIAADIYDENGNLKSYGTNAENLDWKVSGNTLNCRVSWEDQEIELEFSMTLTDDGLRFTLNGDTIQEHGECRLGTVYFLPFFGSVSEDSQPGYIFVPDGSGSLIRFQKARSYLQGFEKRLYGPDYGIDPLDPIQGLESVRTGEYMTEEEFLTAPLFGIVHGAGQNAFLALVEEGGTYARLKVDPAGLITNYYRAYMTFVYRQTYEQPFNRDGEGIATVQPDPNPLQVTMTYRFLHGEDADYVGMAKVYRDYLKEQGALQPLETDGTMPLRVDFLTADVEKEFIGTSVNKITSLSEIEETLDWLSGRNVTNLQVTLLGWQKGGQNGYAKTSSSTRTVYGRLSALDDLRDRLTGLGGTLSLWLSPFTAREGQADLRSEIGISLSQSAIVKSSGEDTFLGDVWYLKPGVGLEALTEQAPMLTEEGYGLMLDDIGYLLYGEYLAGQATTREEVRQQIVDAAAGLASGEKLTMARPADYLYPYVRSYVSIPMVSSQYLFQTDTVPFLQIVLSGFMELYAPYTNLSFFSGADILKMIDYNCYPSFLLTGKDNYSLRNTASSGYRSTYLEDWKEYMVQAYDLISRLLEPVMGQEIEARTVPLRGVAKTEYASGTIYVNYNSESVELDGLTIPGASAVFTDGERTEWGAVI